jgi:hypothetical protein
MQSSLEMTATANALSLDSSQLRELGALCALRAFETLSQDILDKPDEWSAFMPGAASSVTMVGGIEQIKSSAKSPMQF